MAGPISSFTLSSFCSHHFSQVTHIPMPMPLLSLACTLKPLPEGHNRATLTAKAQSYGFSGSIFESDSDQPWQNGGGGEGIGVLEEKEKPQCPPGLRRYETMAVLRPDMTEDERLAFTQKYEELLVAGRGMYVEVFNRGVIPLAYSIKKKNKEGECNTYLDGIYLLFSYFTKPESMSLLEATLKADDDVIRSSNFKVRKRKY